MIKLIFFIFAQKKRAEALFVAIVWLYLKKIPENHFYPLGDKLNTKKIILSTRNL